MTDVVQEPKDCATAEEFLEALSPIGKFFKDQKFNEPWLFRGQGQDFERIKNEDGDFGHIENRARHLMALAQHYGIPLSRFSKHSF